MEYLNKFPTIRSQYRWNGDLSWAYGIDIEFNLWNIQDFMCHELIELNLYKPNKVEWP